MHRIDAIQGDSLIQPLRRIHEQGQFLMKYGSLVQNLR